MCERLDVGNITGETNLIKSKEENQLDLTLRGI
jgi:hypothetical protein